MRGKSRTIIVVTCFIAAFGAFSIGAYLFSLCAVSSMMSATSPAVVAMPPPVWREIHVYEFYDSALDRSHALERELDALAAEFGAYDRRIKIDLQKAPDSSELSEFGINDLPSVVLTNGSRDFRLVFSGADIAARLRASIENNGYSSVSKSGFG